MKQRIQNTLNNHFGNIVVTLIGFLAYITDTVLNYVALILLITTKGADLVTQEKPYRNVQFVLYGKAKKICDRLIKKYKHIEIYEAGLGVLDSIENNADKSEA